MSRALKWLLCLACACAAVAAGCGSESAGDGGDGASQGGNLTEGARVIDPASMDEAKGLLTYCTGKDTSGAQAKSVAGFNSKMRSRGITAQLREFPESPDEQRNQFIQLQRARSGECDVFYSDVVWTAEFASQKWLYDMSPYVQGREDEFIATTFESVNFDNKQWGVPKETNAGFLYYREDQAKEAPTTWQEAYQIAQRKDGIVYSGAAYEGLTVHFLELAFGAGGEVLSADGTESKINSRQNVLALQLMVDGIRSGATPRAVTAYMEERARRVFEAGRATFMRNWPYAYERGTEAPEIKGKFAVAPLPQWEGGKAASILGGHNLVISAYSRNPGAALALIDFLTSPKIEVQDAVSYSLAPTLTASYDDAQVKKALPFADVLKHAVEQGRSRPISPLYPQISQAIYRNVNRALLGLVTPQQALEQAHTDMERALQTF